MTAPPSPAPRDWVTFVEDDGTSWVFDATFLTSNWTCIFGRGCKGVHETDTTERQEGCCSFGAHFGDEDDLERVRAATERLDPTHWQLRAETERLGGPFLRNEDGDWVTRIVDDACCFLNRPDHDAGAGCAFHHQAVELGERPMDWKPEVCWQLPLRLTTEIDENDNTTYTLREWRRADWGTSGDEFHWWCTDSPDAFVSDTRVIDELADEIEGLVGEEPARWITEHLRRRPAERFLAHPARRTDGESA